MKKGKVVASVLLLCLAVLLAGLTDVGCVFNSLLTIPVSIPIERQQMPDVGGELPVGTPLPSTDFEIPLCDLPSLQDLNDLVAAELGPFVAGIAINLVTNTVTSNTAIELVSIKFTAIEGTNFDSLTLLSASWLPSPVDGVQTPVDLGTAQPVPPATGLGTEILLKPAVPVDLLALLLNEADANGSELECAKLIIDLEGTVPEIPPVFSATVSGNIKVKVDGVIMPVILNWFLTNPGSPLAGIIPPGFSIS